jgi:UDP-N-acetylglucosamine 2-epimerase (non-hydrolysing)
MHGMILAEPQGYLDFLCLLNDARMVLTDSGGIQVETSILGIPCLTLRENTEWPETISQGTNHMVGSQPEQIVKAAANVLSEAARHPSRPEYWDGKAAERIVDIIRRG